MYQGSQKHNIPQWAASYLISEPELMPWLDELDAEDDDLFMEDDQNKEQHLVLLQRLLDIRRRAQNCYERDIPEASWGEEVVRPLLDLALGEASLSSSVVAENVFALPIHTRRIASC